MRIRWIEKLLIAAGLLLLLSVTSQAGEPAEVIRVGIIGTTTSHVPAFTGVINDPNAEGVLAEVEVVAGFKGGIEDNPASWDRRERFAEYLEERGCTIYETVDAMLPHVDAVMLEEVDGRPHLKWARPVIKAGKPLFIDKPMAASLADVVEIFRLAEEHDCPCFSSSSTRFASGFQAARKGESPFGKVVGCAAYSPCSLEEHHPDLFWYGVHGVEILFTVMGPGCRSVTRVHTEGTDVVVGQWEDGRVGSFRGIREGKRGYGATVFGTKGIGSAGEYEGYKALVAEICKFFKTGKPPVAAEETTEMFAFMEAADESKRQGGRPVSIESVLEKARQVHAAKQ